MSKALHEISNLKVVKNTMHSGEQMINGRAYYQDDVSPVLRDQELTGKNKSSLEKIIDTALQKDKTIKNN
jgi:hypothetical protein